MITNAKSISDISRERLLSEDENIIPSLNFNFNYLDEEQNLIVILPNYKYKVIRIIFELIDGIRLNNINKSKYRSELDRVLKQKSLIVDNTYEDILGLIFYDKQSNNLEYNLITLTEEDIKLIGLYVNKVGGSIFLNRLDIMNMDKLQIASICNNPQLFLNELNKLSSINDVCCMDEYILYPEDMYDTDNLTLNELNIYTNGMYNEYISLKDLLKSSSLTDGQKELFKRTRCTCGGEFIMHLNGDNYGTLSCINFHCHHKLIWSLSSFVKSMNVLGAGGVSFTKSLVYFWINKVRKLGKSEISYSDLINYDYVNNFGGSLKNKYLQFLDNVSTYDGSIKTLIKLCGLPYIGVYAGEFLNLNVIEQSKDFINFLDFCTNSSIREDRVAFSLFNYLSDIRVVLQFSKAKDLSKAHICKISITHSVLLQNDDGSIKKFRNKQEYVDMLNKYIKDKYSKSLLMFELQESVTRDTAVLIYDTGSLSNQLIKAQSIDIPIMTSREFFQLIIENRGGLLEC